MIKCLLFLFGLVSQGFVPLLGQTTVSVDERVESLLSQMTLEEKIDLLGGVDDMFVRGVPRLGVPRLKMADGPFGVRHYGPSTAMPGGIGLAATWNPTLAEEVGREIARDARAKGVHFLLGPGVNIYRSPLSGRNFEYFGEDPFLASRMAVGYIDGVQAQGVSAAVKHFMGNNSEFDRAYEDSVIDERTMREIYLPVFEAAVKEAHVGAVMGAFNLVNGPYMTENSYLNTEVLKKDWGFDGILMSDWGATHNALAAANGGLDLDMGSPRYFDRAHLLAAVNEGKVPVAVIDDKVRRILRVAVRFGWRDREQADLSIPRYNREADETARKAASESIVLLKNKGGLLPLNKNGIKSIAVIGPDAYPAVPVGGGSARVDTFKSVSFLEGISDYLGKSANVYYNAGLPSMNDISEATRLTTSVQTDSQEGTTAEYFNNERLEGEPFVKRVDRRINLGNFGKSPLRLFPTGALSARWTGYYQAESAGAYEVFVASAGENGGFYRLYVDDKKVLDNWDIVKASVGHIVLPLTSETHKIVLERHGRDGRFGAKMQLGIALQSSLVNTDAKKLASMADAVVLAVGYDPLTEGEGADRTFDLPVGQDELIREIAAANKNTIVVLTSGGGVDMNPWLDKVPALIEAWYPGQEGGRALAEVLFGDVNPSGRLPVTFERRLEDNPTFNSYYPEPGSNRVSYKEGIFVGYRGFERSGTRPLFPFGYGLSYTTFKYNNLAIKPKGSSSEIKYEVSFDITNTGTRPGAEVAQVYVGEEDPKIPRPAKELKGFAKVFLKPAETRRVIVNLNSRSFSYYDTASKQWRADAGKYNIMVGSSVEDIRLTATLGLH
jgi:beta-glucosidase